MPSREKGTPSFENFINKCEFRCLECEEWFYDYGLFLLHLESEHYMDAVSYLVKHQLKEMATSVLNFQCPLCSPNDITNWTRKSFERHANQAWLPDGYSKIFRILCVWPFGLLDYGSATLRCKI